MTAKIDEWMSRDPVHSEPERWALEAFDLMLDRGIRHLPAVDWQRRVVGLLSIDDLRAAFPLGSSPKGRLDDPNRAALRDYRIGELTTYAPYTVRAETSPEQAASLLEEQRIGCLPVMDGEAARSSIGSRRPGATLSIARARASELAGG